MQRAYIQKTTPERFFSKLAPYVNTDTPDIGGNNGTLRLPGR